MKKYTVAEIKTFLKAMDDFAIAGSEIILIGGSAAALAYSVVDTTQDIDSWNNVDRVKEAYEKAKVSTGLYIPFGKVSVSDGPYNFEDRLIDFEPESFKNLHVKVPEVIDLILMKTVRAYEHDLNAIEQMIKTQNVHLGDLVERYIAEMGSVVIVTKAGLDLHFLAMIGRCYGEKAAFKIQEKIEYKA